MKKGILSICISSIGFYLIYKSNTYLYQSTDTLFSNNLVTNPTPKTIKAIAKTYTIIIACIGLLSLYLGIISYVKKSRIGILSIVIALVLLFFTVKQLFPKEHTINTDISLSRETLYYTTNEPIRC